MERSPLAEPATGLAAFDIRANEAELLLDVAERAIRTGLRGEATPVVDIDTLPPALGRRCGAFVTLHVAGELNGCIGDIDGSDELAVDVGRLALRAAFDDPRLPALQCDDLATLGIEISLLSTPAAIAAGTRPELLRQVASHRPGLIVERGRHRGVFLPIVWRQLPRPDDFVDQLLHKAGLPVDPWPHDLAASVFTTASIHRDLA